MDGPDAKLFICYSIRSHDIMYCDKLALRHRRTHNDLVRSKCTLGQSRVSCVSAGNMGICEFRRKLAVDVRLLFRFAVPPPPDWWLARA
jgi:hypothetical protein